ncbi:DUF2500 domain-containing protein [Sporolactobacillus terrae]|uniref:DUF2500 domain-containing protein n=1 Tax=Sporolactobacillus terrae TaxID=269673 RepID=UPI00049111A3|nr:DUF2500 domain-containing protein [Sporolactobacillus terrae]
MDTVDASFQMVQIIIFIGFALVIGGIIFSFVKRAATWSSNKQKPRLRVPAQVVGKRTGTAGGNERPVITHYYATFEMESGDRIEFEVSGSEYGMLAEGDHGMLEFQGTRYLGYQRNAGGSLEP